MCRFFASVFNNTDRLWAAQSSELEDDDYSNSDFSFVNTGTVRDELHRLKIHNAMGPLGLHSRILESVAEVRGPLSIMCQTSWEYGEVCSLILGCIKYNITSR